jgi:predicted deacylase
MAHLGMIPKRGKRPQQPVLSLGSKWVRADESGLFRPAHEIGDHVVVGQKLGVVADPYGETETPLLASCDGLIIGRANIPAVNQGDALFHIARIDDAAKLGAHYDTLEKMLDEDEIL